MKDYISTFFILFLCYMLTSCAKHIYVPVEKESVRYELKTTRDSIYFRDSIFLQIKGDTVLKESFRYIYVDRFVKDTIHIKDSIQVPYPVEVIKYKGDSIKSRFTVIVLSILLGFIPGAILYKKIFK